MATHRACRAARQVQLRAKAIQDQPPAPDIGRRRRQPIAEPVDPAQALQQLRDVDDHQLRDDFGQIERDARVGDPAVLDLDEQPQVQAGFGATWLEGAPAAEAQRAGVGAGRDDVRIERVVPTWLDTAQGEHGIGKRRRPEMGEINEPLPAWSDAAQWRVLHDRVRREQPRGRRKLALVETVDQVGDTRRGGVDHPRADVLGVLHGSMS